jgi:ribosomal protein S18 acetylase RimI-like enzyme
MEKPRIASLTKKYEKTLLEFMNRDRISHFFSIYDLQHYRGKTRVWLTFLADRIVGYLLEYNKKILCLRGPEAYVAPLLRKTRLVEAILNVEARQLPAVKRFYKPVEPADKMTVGRITTFVVMKVTSSSFRPVVNHEVQELKNESVAELAGLLGASQELVLDLLRGFAFGLYESEELVSYAASPEMLKDLAIVRGVFTAPEKRCKGYSKAVCSALVSRLLGEGKEVMLYVSEDNAAALSVYRSLGFMETGHRFLGFIGRRRD